MLTEHQLFHLNAILAEANETINLSVEDKDIWMNAKAISPTKEDDYINAIIADVEGIIKNGVFPDLEHPSMIHDYIEKETKESFR